LLPHSKQTETQRIPRDRARVRGEARHRQADELLHRARILQRAIGCLLVALGCLVLASLAVGTGVFFPFALYAAGGLFAVGLSFVFAGVVQAFFELRLALGPIEMEHALVVQLAKEIPETEAKPSP
jgi:fatty acid desaturase